MAAKRMDNKSALANKEAWALKRAADFQVPRVVKLVQQIDLPDQQTYLVMQ